MHKLLSLTAIAVLIAMAPLRTASSAGSESMAQEIREGFLASAALVSDADWREKWNTPRASTPNFTPADMLVPGDKATLLIFFANPLVRDGKVVVFCDLEILSEEGRLLGKAQPTPCAGDGRLKGPATDTYLSGMVVDFKVTGNGPFGRSVFRIGVEDRNRGVRIPLVVAVQVRQAK